MGDYDYNDNVYRYSGQSKQILIETREYRRLYVSSSFVQPPMKGLVQNFSVYTLVFSTTTATSQAEIWIRVLSLKSSLASRFALTGPHFCLWQGLLQKILLNQQDEKVVGSLAKFSRRKIQCGPDVSNISLQHHA